MAVEQWRSVAFLLLPGFRNCVEEAQTVRDLWARLYDLSASPWEEPLSESDVAAIFRYETWCLAHSSDEEAQSAVLWFYTELPHNPRLRRELPKHMTIEDFLGSQEVFACQLTPAEYDRFREEFLTAACRLRASVPAMLMVDVWAEHGAPN